MTNGIRRSLVVAVAASACALGGPSRRSSERSLEPGVRIWAPNIVHWDPAGTRHVSFAIENATNRTLTLAPPDPANARVDLYAGPESIRVCGATPREGPSRKDAPRPEPVALEPGDRLSVRVDLEESCAGLAPGDYRYEISYRIPDVGKAAAVKGTLPTSYGEVVVDARAPARRGPAIAAPERPAEGGAAEPRAGRAPPSRPHR